MVPAKPLPLVVPETSTPSPSANVDVEGLARLVVIGIQRTDLDEGDGEGDLGLLEVALSGLVTFFGSISP